MRNLPVRWFFSARDFQCHVFPSDTGAMSKKRLDLHLACYGDHTYSIDQNNRHNWRYNFTVCGEFRLKRHKNLIKIWLAEKLTTLRNIFLNYMWILNGGSTNGETKIWGFFRNPQIEIKLSHSQLNHFREIEINFR